jgi:hypothetical protein
LALLRSARWLKADMASIAVLSMLLLRIARCELVYTTPLLLVDVFGGKQVKIALARSPCLLGAPCLLPDGYFVGLKQMHGLMMSHGCSACVVT